MRKDKANKIFDILLEMYPDATCELDYTSTFELLVATVLSAQTTDVKVNQVTPNLFKRANTPEKMMELTEVEISEYIKHLGLYKSKAKYLFLLSEKLVIEFGSVVPSSLEDLVSLSGVGRKTANVVRSEAFRIPSLAVDTHVRRLANRLGFSNTENVLIIEEDIKKVLPKSKWILTHHLLIFHGRRTCKARSPECIVCRLQNLCNYYKKNIKK